MSEARKFSWYKSNVDLIQTYNKVLCDGCGKDIPLRGYDLRSKMKVRNNIYCSRLCYMAIVSKTIDIECHNCNVEMSVSPAYLKRSRRHFCSNDCKNKYRARSSVVSELCKILDFDIRL